MRTGEGVAGSWMEGGGDEADGEAQGEGRQAAGREAERRRVNQEADQALESTDSDGRMIDDRDGTRRGCFIAVCVQRRVGRRGEMR